MQRKRERNAGLAPAVFPAAGLPAASTFFHTPILFTPFYETSFADVLHSEDQDITSSLNKAVTPLLDQCKDSHVVHHNDRWE